MDALQAMILGIIQGLTEFLPVSSSGHLVIFQHLFGLKEPELFFDICVHLGTLLAVIIVFRQEIRELMQSLGHLLWMVFVKDAHFEHIFQNSELKMLLLVFFVFFITAMLGVVFHEIGEHLFSSVLIVGLMLFITGGLLWLTRRVKQEGRGLEAFSIRTALIIGLVQGLAIMPGISRSGSTIALGLFLGLSRELSARYSFLLAIPAILGAGVLSIHGLIAHPGGDYKIALIGAAVSFIVGYFSLVSLLHMVKKAKLYIFAPYCWAAGIAALLIVWR
ncbi:MAG: undecaprenyl-diphosphate phosphatase [Deltaproteobacteria bacterium]|jgi:undecaprenyl-diphosphatase|nr:undecaprenyl-diphosphate phosphatase [Deltaproteobacteria bacterium]